MTVTIVTSLRFSRAKQFKELEKKSEAIKVRAGAGVCA
jgi:hypothetical protein